jgi:hypothetical protein
MSGKGDPRWALLFDDVLAMGECGLPEAEWRGLVRVAPELAQSLATAGAGIRAAKWDALKRMLALLPPGGGTIDERFNRMRTPTAAEPGSPMSDEESDWVLVAVYARYVGWAGRPLPGHDLGEL